MFEKASVYFIEKSVSLQEESLQRCAHMIVDGERGLLSPVLLAKSANGVKAEEGDHTGPSCVFSRRGLLRTMA